MNQQQKTHANKQVDYHGQGIHGQDNQSKQQEQSQAEIQKQSHSSQHQHQHNDQSGNQHLNNDHHNEIHHSSDDHHGTHYNPLQMPCNWDIARKHALSRRTAKEKKKDPLKTLSIETCPCCGFEVDREDIPFCSDPMALSFLGSGFALFYNYLKYCIIILFIQLLVKQIHNLYTNFNGSYCSHIKREKMEGHIIEEPYCPDSIFLRLSLANKLDNREALEMMQLLNFISIFIIMFLLIYFRKSQRQIDTTIDEEQLTPADYTICVKNIPTGLSVDYKYELKNLFENYSVLDSTKTIIVRKVVLVYDIEEIIELEKQLDQLIQQKKDAIKKCNFNFHHENVQKIEKEIEHLEHQIHMIEEDYETHNTNFSGMAFVSFDDESMKQLVLQDNPHTQWERMRSHINRGQLRSLSNQDLQWQGQKLFLEQAPEPNDVDWEFIHITTSEKILKRIRAWVYYILFESAAFFIIYLISHRLALLGDEAHEEELKGKLDYETKRKINILSFTISMIIVLFNKFGVAKIVHYIVDDEKISNKTKFQISFVYKYALALFLNAAIISFLVDIVILKNVKGAGGFIQNESQIFVLNAIFPPFIWCVDPWSFCKNIWRKYIMSKGDRALLTQQEANKLMEEPDYLSAKRYSDVMKTMWFTFMYGTAIPLGTLFSAFGILIYYFVDYYNILRRRTVKESISIQLSTEMIEMLEYIIAWCAFGEMTMTYTFFKEVSKIDILLIVMAILYQQLPMEDISEYLFPVENNEEKLFLEQAPEPNDVDWEFIHITTSEKILKRIRAWVYYILFESAAFFIIYLISHRLALLGDEAHEEELKGKLDYETKRKINILSFTISMIIVLFNKFGVAKIVHYIVDDEKISNKTKFQISFVYKYALALFLNAAIISFLVDIVILKNVKGAGGFIQNESQIFVLNAIFPPFIWCVDPWSFCKNIWRKYIMSKGDRALLTQQEANKLMEEPDYLSAKRYSDVMKTMWFTFMYGTAIPLGTLFSAFGILIYYFVDYYNILRRRTVKESISIQLSTEMIEMLEYIIAWCAFGEMTMTYTFFKEVSKIDILLIVMAILYQQLPMEDISEYLFPVENNEEIKPYAEGSANFDTDYDRENPVTRHKALNEWNQRIQNTISKNKKILAQQDEFGYAADGHFGRR
ncbi:unnamed protein product [Paramecium sonneborni]|uniref:CSC1/OSCA1-like cytosolic domain-containing protein n=1 Tax=Paramecium sonneborni TaxID=65129 RepID=A0A8S1LM69_9CILI|nr:unnamed protein product [Paramecium sonneborni]